MAFQMITNDEYSIYLTPPTTPSSPYPANLEFYSVPTTPFRHNPTPFDQPQTEPATPKSCAYEDATGNFIDFEFETSRRVDDYDSDYHLVRCFESPVEEKRKKEEEDSGMAFADELFCDGKMMPLKPPPCFFQKGMLSGSSSCSSPNGGGGVMKFPFSRRSLWWNDDFDPFMVALENVKVNDHEEKVVKRRNREEQRDRCRRARSVSPLRARSPQRPNKSMSFHYHTKIGPDNGQESRTGPLVKMGHGKPKKGESEEEESKRKKTKKLLFRSASKGRANDEEKQKDKRIKKSSARIFSFRSTGHCKEEKSVSQTQMNKETATPYKPKLFVCMGYGAKKYVK